jgi:hypothetical protein
MSGTLTAKVLTGTVGNNTFSIAKATLDSIDMLGGKNTLNIAKNAQVTINGNVDNVTTLKVAAGATFSAQAINNVNKLTVDKNATFTSASITGTEKNDTIKFAAGEAATITGSIELGLGKDTLDIARNVTITGNVSNVETLKIAKDLTVTIAGKASDINKFTVNKGANVDVKGVISGTAKKDTLTLGANATLKVQGIQDIETVNASKNSILIVDNGYDNDIELTAGSWKNATIHDLQGFIDTTEKRTLEGWVYSNEFDIYAFKVEKLTDTLTLFGEGIEGVTINLAFKEDDGSFTTSLVHSGDIAFGSFLEFDKTGDYALLVSVDGSDLNKETKEDNHYSIAVQLTK